MQSFFNAVGLGSRSSSKPPSKKNSQLGGSSLDDLLPNLANIAAATESGILTLEEEARALEQMSPGDAANRIQGWSQSLRQRPRPEESLASFRAKFLRSNAMERSIEGLRRNGAVCAVLADKPLFTQVGGSASSTTPATDGRSALASEIRTLLQLCLQKSAAPLADPALRVAVCETKEQSFMAMTALRVFKEDWTEVVHNQAMKGLERRLDSLSYQLQKSGVARKEHLKGESDTTGMRRASRDRVIVLALLCTTLEEAHSRSRSRIAEVAAALNAAGLYSLAIDSASGPPPRSASKGSASAPDDSTERSFSSDLPSVPRLPGTGGPLFVPRPRADSGCAPSSGAASERTYGTAVHGCTGSACTSRDEVMPTAADCEAAVSLMARKTEDGMREGLRLLGLPDSPLQYAADAELKLCGHDIHESINAMVNHWVQEERAPFFDALQQLRREVNQGPAERSESGFRGALAAEKRDLMEERQKLLDKLKCVDERLSTLDSLMNKATSPDDDPDGILAEGTRPPLRGLPTENAMDCSFQHPPSSPVFVALASSKRSSPASTPLGPGGAASHVGPRAAMQTAVSRAQLLHENAKTAAELDDVHGEFTAAIAMSAEAFATETRRVVERVATQLQQRRGQLYASLALHLESERERLFARALADDVKGISNTGEGSAAAKERLEKSLNTARELCKKAEAAFGVEDCQAAHSNRGAPLAPGFRPGALCQARWLDGSYYDASVQTVMGDRSVVVNWLRPRAPGSGPPLKTVSEAGGDDTLCRIVPVTDVRLLDEDQGNGPQPSLQSRTGFDAEAALAVFRSRGPEDYVCADCRATCASSSSSAGRADAALDPTVEWDADACADPIQGASGASASVVKWASISFGTYLCGACAGEHSRLGAHVSLVRRLGDGAGWKPRDLKYMSRGGNAAYVEALRSYPHLDGLPLPERLSSRFAEYYRRQLDARCTGAQLPPAPPAEIAAQPAVGEFIGAAEGAAAVREALQRFEAGAGLAALPSAWRGIGGSASFASPGVSSAPGPSSLTPPIAPSRSRSIASPYAL